MTPFAIAGLQLQLSAQHHNLDHIKARMETLMYLYPWVQMVVVSELATFGGFTGHAQPLPSPAEDAYREFAARHKIWLLPGSLFEQVGDKVYNTVPVINPDGEIIARYRKMFPFLPYETGVEAGSEFCIFDIPDVGRFGVSICYDMWFPETSRTLAAMGAEVILHPTLTASIDREVELSIARTTAACNQCFVIDINGSGDLGTGQSIIVGPVGDVLYQAGHGQEMIPLEIDLDRARRAREVGLRGLGQPLKSFRDSKIDFRVYDKKCEQCRAYLHTLGPLEKPARGSRAGLDDVPKPPAELPDVPPAPGSASEDGKAGSTPSQSASLPQSPDTPLM
jgi:deaminated glutathione amidase